jgi:NAD(P)-dependent dehydrogenase (short-subunit alcohol dehydrogenase family)
VALGRLGAEVWVIGRDPDRCDAVGREIEATGGTAVVSPLDVTVPDAVDRFVTRFSSSRAHLHGLVHGAGALLARYERSDDGVEMTVATHVLAPYRMTWLLAPHLRAVGDATIVTVSSGGMYTERFDVARLEMTPDAYDGVRAYARAKRAQVVLAHEWARRWHADGVSSYAMHPGWVETPGLTAGLPGFARLGPLLRRPAEGADTVVWLVAGGAPTDDGFWHDRRPRGEYYLPWTRPQQLPESEARRLWSWCARRTGLGAT